MHGIFDSGVGGLSVWKELKLRFPDTGFLYFADQAHLPYGSLEYQESLFYVKGAIDTLIDAGATSITLACHTISTTIGQELRPLYPVPIYDISSSSFEEIAPFKKVAVIGTVNTIQSQYFQKILRGKLHSATACPKLVPMVEKGVIEPKTIRSSLLLIPPGADCVLLGCTHFAFIADEISKALGGIKVIDPARAFANQIPHLSSNAPEKFFTTGDVKKFHALSEKLLKRKLSFPFFIKPLYFHEKPHFSSKEFSYESKEKNITN